MQPHLRKLKYAEVMMRCLNVISVILIRNKLNVQKQRQSF